MDKRGMPSPFGVPGVQLPGMGLPGGESPRTELPWMESPRGRHDPTQGHRRGSERETRWMWLPSFFMCFRSPRKGKLWRTETREIVEATIRLSLPIFACHWQYSPDEFKSSFFYFEFCFYNRKSFLTKFDRRWFEIVNEQLLKLSGQLFSFRFGNSSRSWKSY